MAGIKITVPAAALVVDRAELRQVLRAAGQEVAAVARSLIRKSAGTRGKHPSAPGEPPASRTGALASGISVRSIRGGEGVRIVDRQFYSRFLETGAKGGGGNTAASGNFRFAKSGRRRMRKGAVNRTRVMEPRPFLSRAADEREASIRDRVIEAIAKGIKFQKLKP